MARGDWAAMRWLLRAYDREARADFLARRGDWLTPRERAFWCLVSGVPNVASAGGARPRGPDDDMSDEGTLALVADSTSA